MSDARVRTAFAISKTLAREWRIDHTEILTDVYLSVVKHADLPPYKLIRAVKSDLRDVWRSFVHAGAMRKVLCGGPSAESNYEDTHKLVTGAADRVPFMTPLQIWEETWPKRAMLDWRERIYLYLWAVEQWTQDEIAETFKTTGSYVSYRILKARTGIQGKRPVTRVMTESKKKNKPAKV